MKVVTRKQVSVPEGVCLNCFNEQQRFSFPFLVYCRHGQTLALMKGPHAEETLHCLPNELKEGMHQVASRAGIEPATLQLGA